MRITICGISELGLHCAAGVTHVLSILDPTWPDPDAFVAFLPHRREALRFHDVIAPLPGAVMPTSADIERLLQFGREVFFALTAFVLVYSAEHFVVDILLGWALAAMVSLVFDLFDSWWSRRRASTSALADPAEPATDLAGGLSVEGAVDPVGDVADVRRGDHSVQRAQRVHRRQRLGVEDVETDSGEPLRPQCVDEGRLVDDWAARCVD